MTTLGLSIATEQKHDVVRPITSAHETLLATSQDDIFSALLREAQPSGLTVATSQVQNDLGQIVVELSGVNLNALRSDDIPELQSSKAIARFQRIIRDAARKVERGVEREEYESQLRVKGQAILDAWQQVRQELRKNLRDTLFQSAVPLVGAALKSSINGSDALDLAIAGGVAVIVAASKVRSLLKKSVPYQYLTQVASAQDPTLRLTFPLVLEA